MPSSGISSFDDLVATGTSLTQNAGREPLTKTELAAAIVQGGDWLKAATIEYGQRFEAVLTVAAATAGQLPDDLENLDLGMEDEAFNLDGLELHDKAGRVPLVAWNFSEDGELRLPYPVHDADPFSGLAELHAALLYPGVAHDEDAPGDAAATWTAAILHGFDLVQRLWKAMPEDQRTQHPTAALIAGYWTRPVPVEPAPKDKRRILSGSGGSRRGRGPARPGTLHPGAPHRPGQPATCPAWL